MQAPRRRLTLAWILVTLIASPAGAQIPLSVPNLSTPEARARALEESRAWLAGLASNAGPGSDRLLVPDPDRPLGFAVVDARTFELQLDAAVANGRMSPEERDRRLARVRENQPDLRRRVRRLRDRVAARIPTDGDRGRPPPRREGETPLLLFASVWLERDVPACVERAAGLLESRGLEIYERRSWFVSGASRRHVSITCVGGPGLPTLATVMTTGNEDPTSLDVLTADLRLGMATAGPNRPSGSPAPTGSRAPVPGLYFAQDPVRIDPATCARRAERALPSRGFRIRTRSDAYVTGAIEGRLSATVTCPDTGRGETIVTVIVAGGVGHRAEAMRTRDALRADMRR